MAMAESAVCCALGMSAMIPVTLSWQLMNLPIMMRLFTSLSTIVRMGVFLDGRWHRHDGANGQQLKIDKDFIGLYQQSDPPLPWQSLDIDLVMECRGGILCLLVRSTVGRVQKSFIVKSREVITAIVDGVNQHIITRDDLVLSAASCTSNALIPVLSTLDHAFGVANGVITTIHASMHDQPVIDAYHSSDLRRNRAASQSIIPVDTALAQGVDRVLPELEGKMVAHALRVPVNNVSALNVTLNIERDVTVAQVNQCLRQASLVELNGVLGYTEDLLASRFNQDSRRELLMLTRHE